MGSCASEVRQPVEAPEDVAESVIQIFAMQRIAIGAGGAAFAGGCVAS